MTDQDQRDSDREPVKEAPASSAQDPGAEAADAEAPKAKRPWVTPKVIKIVAGSAEAISRDGQPDGGGPGQSRS